MFYQMIQMHETCPKKSLENASYFTLKGMAQLEVAMDLPNGRSCFFGSLNPSQNKHHYAHQPLIVPQYLLHHKTLDF
jgi:hypothetical protein